MNKIYTDGIIFDMDGTIWDNTPVFADSWERACKDMGYDVKFTTDKLKGLFGKTMTDIADACIPDEVPEKRYATLKLCEEYEMDDLEKTDVDTTYDGLKETLGSGDVTVSWCKGDCSDIMDNGKYFGCNLFLIIFLILLF